MNILHQRKIVLLGMMTRMPVAGVIWQVAHYLVGFQRLGYDVYYVEDSGIQPSGMLQDHPGDDPALKAAGFIAGVMKRLGMEGRWAHRAMYGDGKVHGMSDSALLDLYREAE